MKSIPMVVLALLALALGLSSSHEEHNEHLLHLDGYYEGTVGKRPWSCCDKCMCTFTIPLQCRCHDLLRSSCHPNCKNCVKLAEDVIAEPLYQCVDVIPFSCGALCHQPGRAEE